MSLTRLTGSATVTVMQEKIATTTCPNCDASLGVTSVGVTLLRTHALPEGDAAGAVAAFTERLRGRFPATELKRMYDERAPEAGWPPMSPKMFGRCLRSAGAQPGRSDSTRWWELPG